MIFFYFGRHTTTHMGSGHLLDEGFGKVSYFHNLEIVDNHNILQAAQDIEVKATNMNSTTSKF